MRRTLLALALAAGTLTGIAAEPPATTKPSEPTAVSQPLFATVGSTAIGVAEYDAAYAQMQRQRFYHRKAPDHEVRALKREVGDTLINRVLLLEEAGRRGIGPDRGKIDAALAGYEKQYGGSPQWPRMKAEALPALVAELERQSRVEQLERVVREVGTPGDAQLQAFYDKNNALFTEPAKQRVSLILLKVDPSSTQAVWDQAMEEGKAIAGRLAKGADFAEAARLHSGDQSAASGGDMGFMHRGAIAEHVAQRLDKLALNEVSEPLQILEGIGIFKVTERVDPQLHALPKVRDRAIQLWKREQSELAWKGLIEKLRAGASINVLDSSRYPELASTTAPAPTVR